ncbi:SDR family NAD(P)-dependent oxidoreductase, partial [Mycobacterium sp. NPDC003449]
LDILINNAGIIRDRSFVKSTPDDFDAVIAVHLRGTYLTSAQAFRHMREAGYGRIVNTTSAAGLYGNFGQANYSAAKLGIVGLSRTMAIEGASRGVSTNVIAPGAKSRMTDSPGVPGLDAMKASLVAPVVAWLSHESCTENGQVYSASSGRVCRHFIGETPGIYDPELTIETVARRAGEIADATGSVTPDNITEHMEFSEQVRSGAEVSTS